MTKKFEGKVALVTGAATGIGRGGALFFAKEGAKVVVVTGSNVTGAEETVAMIKAAGGEATFIQCDVRNETSVEAMVAGCVKTYGRLDYAFNNAGVGPDGVRLPVIDITECSEEIWDKTIDTNLTGVFFCLKHEMRQMKKQGTGGAIVNTSSIGAISPIRGFCAYSASKAGINALTTVAALEGAPDKIRVNAIMPGPTENTLLFQYLTSASPEAKKDMTTRIPLGRVATPEDMANTVVWLCSEEGSYITGHSIPVSGGFSG